MNAKRVATAVSAVLASAAILLGTASAAHATKTAGDKKVEVIKAAADQAA
ncbi:hypothetical protein ACFVIM_20590 [Streptomyces sp. NPDC057638]